MATLKDALCEAMLSSALLSPILRIGKVPMKYYGASMSLRSTSPLSRMAICWKLAIVSPVWIGPIESSVSNARYE